VTDGGEDDWRYELATDLTGYIDCTRHAVERMKRRGSGHIVNIGSISAVHVNKGMSLYVAAKSAVAGFSRAMRKELGEHNIKVSLIEPGMVGTEILEGEESDPALQRRDEDRCVMLKPEDIAVAVHYCLTQPARCTISRLQIQPLLED
jgi:NADP-dependent 3-hydroxy acid dehydrogenase YdfG